MRQNLPCIYYCENDNSKINDTNTQFGYGLRMKTGRKSYRGKMNGSAKQSSLERQLKAVRRRAIAYSGTVSYGISEDQRENEVKLRAKNMLKDDCNTEKLVASVKDISSLIPTLQKINIDTIRIVNNTYPYEGEDMPGKCEKDMWEDKSFINLNGLGQTLNKIDSEAQLVERK